MINLRHYQADVKKEITDALQTYRSVLAVMPTGAGKTVTFCSVVNDHRGASAAVVHRKEILAQISLSLAALEIKHRVIAPRAVVTFIRRKQLKKHGRSFIDPGAPCGVVSVQTLTSKGARKKPELMAWVNQVTLAVFDEGHHYTRGGLWGRAVDVMPNARRLFVTATPERTDGVGLGTKDVGGGGFAEVMIEGPTMGWLIEQGYLSPYSYKAPETDLDLDNIPITASGDVSTVAMRARVVDSHLVGDVVAQYLQFTPGKKAIVFANDVATSEELAAAFRAKGVRAQSLSGATDDAERDAVLADFENGDLDVLCNCELFDEGFDVPAVEVVILARVTASLGKYLQMCGRGLRPVYAAGYDFSTAQGRAQAIANGPKPAAVIIDPCRNWERHGLPHWPRSWSLASREKGSRGAGSDTLPQHVCRECTQPFLKVLPACPMCGTPAPEPQARAQPAQVAGNLFDLDLAAMDELFKKINAADMTDEDFTLQQIAKNVPAPYRAKGLRHHRAAKHRRAVLRDMVGRWVGIQEQGLRRALPEVHKRFFYRFGVDIGTAFTLGEKDTDKLIDTIQRRYAQDLKK